MNGEGGEQRALAERGKFQKRSLRRRVLASPLSGAVIALFGILTGFVGSIYATELKCAVEAVLPFTSNHAVLVFGLGVVVIAGLVFGRQMVVDDAREHVQKRFDTTAKEVASSIETLRSLPDHSFLSEFNLLFRTNTTEAEKLTDVDAQLDGMLVALQGFAELAEKFDGSIGARFAANLMLFVSAENAKPWHASLSFFDGDPQKLDGVLVLLPELAAVSGGVDSTMAQFCLPVPREHGTPKSPKGVGGWKTLPGAPTAYVNNKFEHYAVTSLLHSWCHDFGDFTDTVKSEIQAHFASLSKEISGFMCIPIEDPYQNGCVIGILNIH